jgi:hypothetical protein
MSDLTIRGILGAPSREDVLRVILALQATDENPVTDWHVGAVWRTMLKLEAHVIHDLVTNALPDMAEGAYLDTSGDEWITTLARYWYEIDRVQAGIARQTVTLACATGYGPYTIAADRLILSATDGKRYLSETGGSLTGGNTLAIDVIAEGPGAARGLVSGLVTQLAGVTIADAAIRVITGVPQYGADEESVGSVSNRCDGRWPDIETIGEEDRVSIWAKAASTEITRIRLDADPSWPGGVLVTVAGVSGAVSGGAVTAARAYIDDRQAITDLNTVQNASNLSIDATGTVTVPTEHLAAIQAAADDAWVSYLAGAQIGASVYVSELIQAIMDAGAIDAVVALSGADPNGNVALSSNEVPIAGGSLAAQLTWVVTV